MESEHIRAKYEMLARLLDLFATDTRVDAAIRSL